ncbi:MAG: hypothetical protein DI582_03015 [Azospirillum brasilense]|nr:MAG: hypothetical protein DI582_03015 [Azospirillum brasilense]
MRLMPRQFMRDQQGLALLEFALVMPFLLLIFLGGAELTRFILIAQRLDRAAYAITDVTAQFMPATPKRESAEISETVLRTAVLPQFSRIMGVYSDETRQAIILSSVRRESGINRVKWQIAGGGSLNDGDSRSVVNGRTPAQVNPTVINTTATFTPVAGDIAGMMEGENIVVGEMFYHYEPFLQDILSNLPQGLSIPPVTLARRMYFVPRYESLTCLPDNFTDASC